MAENQKENKDCKVHIPELRISIPQVIIKQLGDIRLPTSIVLIIPTEITQNSADGEETHVRLRYYETEVQWRVNTVVGSLDITRTVDTSVDLTMNSTKDTIPMTDSDSDQASQTIDDLPCSQSMLSHQ